MSSETGLIIHPNWLAPHEAIPGPPTTFTELTLSRPRLTLHQLYREFWIGAHLAPEFSYGHHQQMKLALDRLKESNGGAEIYVTDITASLLERFLRWRADPNNPRRAGQKTVAKELRYLRGICRFAIKSGHLRPDALTLFDPLQPIERLTVRRLFTDLYTPARLSRAAQGHVQQMELTIARLNEFAGAEVYVDELTVALLDQFRAWRSDKRSPRYCSVATMNKDLRNIRALVNFAYRRDLLRKRVSIEFDFEPKKSPQAWFPEELAALFRSAAQETGTLDGTGIPAAEFWQALLALIYSTGARIDAVMKLPRRLVDLERGLVTFTHDTQKQRADQVVGLHDEAVKAIRAIWLPERELMFPWPYGKNDPARRVLRSYYRRILQRAGLPDDRLRLFHCLRKTTATYIAASSDVATARQQLGHSAESVTARYIDARQINPRSSQKLIAPPPIAEADAVPRDPCEGKYRKSSAQKKVVRRWKTGRSRGGRSGPAPLPPEPAPPAEHGPVA